ERIASSGLHYSRINEILLEESVIGWKEFELEIMRDKADNVVIICSIENMDPMGIHTGDSITVAPAQTLTDRQYQNMRDASLAVMREIGVETGGSNIQFAVNPADGRMVVIEMNPRVSRSSALASKATGFPIAKFAAKLAVGYTLDEISNDITKETPASFEPVIDYCVVKLPRFTFEKFPEADARLGVQMKSVGETMAIGRTFKEAFQKGLRGLEIRKNGFESKSRSDLSKKDVLKGLKELSSKRVFLLRCALDKQIPVEKLSEVTGIDPWFINNMKDIVDFERGIDPEILNLGSVKLKEFFREAKEMGFSDNQIAGFLGVDDNTIRTKRRELSVEPVYKLVDTCAAEFEAYTPYYYSTYDYEGESGRTGNRKFIIVGGGPNRIGQGIEFDYCCCQASYALEELGYESIIVNSNPETVSTDYDTSDRLYFEPLTHEDIMNIIEKENADGVIVQFGGQTPVNCARKLSDNGAPIIGTSVGSIDRAEDRDEFNAMMRKLNLSQPEGAVAGSPEEAREIAARIEYPILLRPSFVLGGRGMRIIYNDNELDEFIAGAKEAGEDRPVLIDKFLNGALEIDVDAVSDGDDVIVCGIMEHIEEAGVHSGDSACVLPPHTLSEATVELIKDSTVMIAKELEVIGLLNIQFAVEEDEVFVLEVNPRASRTVPFVSKATGVPWVKIATKVMTGLKLSEIEDAVESRPNYFSVKESVMPFNKFPGADTILGPEMKSTGEVMGIDIDLGLAYAKSQLAAGNMLPRMGSILISVKSSMHRNVVFLAKKLKELGFKLYATSGTFRALSSAGINVKRVEKIGEGKPNIVDHIKSGDIDLIINVPAGSKSLIDSRPIRQVAVSQNIPYITTMEGAQAAVSALDSLEKTGYTVKSIQEYGNKNKKSASHKEDLNFKKAIFS
ncbi:MAG: carbamoyl-phosphate synthase large subunit, partial [Chitinivibrionales bacterium]